MAPDSKQFVRQWNREIEDEARRLAAAPAAAPWKLILWVVLELFWGVVLVAMILWLKRLAW